MAQLPWYPHYVGDYGRKTSHLSLLEHGAFRLLLDHYYSTRSPLPNDVVKLCRICRARTPSERKAVALVVAEFFTEDGSLLRNKRCDSEIDKLLKYSEKQSAAAQRRLSHGSAMDQLHARVPHPDPQPHSEPELTSKPIITTQQSPLTPHRQFRILELLGEDGIDKARRAAPGYDVYYLASLYDIWVANQEKPNNPKAAFIAWVKKHAQRNPL